MTHNTVLLLFVAGLVLVSGVVVTALKGGGEWAYSAKPVLTPMELVVFSRLRQVFPEYTVLAQVSLSQVVHINATGKRRQAMFNRVSAKSVDFALCQHDFRIVVAIELDDKTHDRPIQRKRDADKNRVMEAAGIPLLRWRQHTFPSSQELRREVDVAIRTANEAKARRAGRKV